jgi:hypothetical protein
MLTYTRLFLVTVTISLSFFGFVADISAQSNRNPTMTSQRSDSDKENLYAKYSENKKVPSPERQRLAYDAARDYVKLYGSDTDHFLPEMRKFVANYERGFRHSEIQSAYTAKKYTKVFELGRSVLQLDPEDFYVLSTLVEGGYGNAQSGNVSLNEETIGYARKAIELLDGNKVTNADPFPNLEAGRGFLNLALGWFLRTQSPVEAAAALVKAAKSDSSYKSDPLTYNLLGIAILKGEYAQVSADYNSKYGNKPPSPEQQATLEHINQVGARAVDAYARAVALTTNPEQQEARNKMLSVLTALYKSFHNNSDAGLSDLIANVLTKPLP